MKRVLVFLPVLIFAGLAIFMFKGLNTDTRTIPSALIGKSVPEFSLAGLKSADLKTGKVTLVNIFASWCGPCRQEHPMLMSLAKRSDIKIIGINNKDEPENSKKFLDELGNPYALIGDDADGRVSIEWGGYGVPETYVIDGKGIIKHRIIGPIHEGNLAVVLQEIEKAK